MIAQNVAETLLKPYLEAIRNAILSGFKHYHAHYGEQSAKHHPRTRAALINDHIVDYAQRHLAALPDVKKFSLFGRQLFQVQNQLLLHFKKLDSRKLPSNYPTLFALDFSRQRQLELPGISATLPRLVAGFIPSADWSRIQAVYVTCPLGDQVAWFIDLAAEPQQIQTFNLGHNEIELSPVIRRKRVRVKTSVAERRESAG